MSLDLIERADRPLNRAACALYDALVANTVRAAIRRVRAFRRALAAIPWEVPG